VLLSLLRFILRTRFSRPFLIFLVIMLAYSGAIIHFTSATSVSVILGYYAAGIVAFFLAMALATGGVMIMKSDRDYLFTLPLSTRDLSLSIFFSQFIAFGATVLIMFSYFAQVFASPLMLVDLAALALIFTSLGLIATSLQTKVRLTLSVALALWTLLSFANFQFTPGSEFNGNLLGGTATLIVLAGVTIAFAFRGLSRVELDMMKNLVRSSSAEVKSPNSFAGKSPVGAIYSMNLSSMSLAGRFNMAGASRYVSRRVKTRWVVAATSAAAAAYFVFVLFIGQPTGSHGVVVLPAETLVAVILSMLAFFFSQSAITNERIWLSLTSLPAASYFRHLVASRVISLLMILVPFAVADVALLALGYGGALGALTIVLTVVPGSFVLEMCWAAYIAPIQIKGDDMMMPAQFSLRQFVTVLPMIAVVILAAASSVSPTVAAVGGFALVVTSVILTMSGGFWGRVVTRLTENGFV
jgi:hypothetical protein